MFAKFSITIIFVVEKYQSYLSLVLVLVLALAERPMQVRYDQKMAKYGRVAE